MRMLKRKMSWCVPKNGNATRSGLPIARLQNRKHIERLGQVCMSGERISCLTFDEDVHTLDSRNVDGQSLHQRVYGELLVENAGAVLVGKGGIQIDDGRAWIDQVDAANVRRRGQRMGGARLLVDAQQRAQQLLRSLLESSGKRNLRGAGAEQTGVVIRYIQSHRLRRTGGWGSDRERAGCCRRFESNHLTPHSAKGDFHR